MVVIQGAYDLTQVGFSIFVAIFVAFISIDLLSLYLHAEERSERIKWQVFFAISLGIGIWITHFLGMFAYKLPMAVHYDGLMTLMSLLVAIAAVFAGVTCVRKSRWRNFVYGGILMGGGISGMHYMGIYAMHMQASHVYDQILVVLSILVAMVSSGAGLFIIGRLCKNRLMDSVPLKLLVASVMGVAIFGTHYIGMAAIAHVDDHTYVHQFEDKLFAINSDFLMIELVAGGLVLLLFNFYTAASEKALLNRLNIERKLLKNSELRMITLLENIADAVVVIDGKGIIELYNKSAEEMFGYDRSELLGKNISILMTGRDQCQHDGYMQHYMKTGESKIIDVGTRQLTAVNKQGKNIKIGLSVNKVETDNGLQFIGVIRDMTDYYHELDKLTKRAEHDSLTGLVNRYKLFLQLEHSISLAKRNSTKVCFMFIDLDGFKEVNDQHGHDAGDELLRQASVKLLAQVRDSDVVSRFGGDEFCVLFEAVEDIESMKKVSENILSSLQVPFHLFNNTVTVTASIGVSFYPDDSEDDGDLIKHADKAMYAAKNAGKNQCQFFMDMQDS